MRFNKFLWNLYKSSEEGVKAIERFSENRDFAKDLSLIERYCPDFIKSDEQREAICGILEDLWIFKVSCREEKEISTNEAAEIYRNMIDSGFSVGEEAIIKPEDYTEMVGLVPLLSIELNAWCKDLFFPYLYVNRFYDLKKCADYFEIDIPEVPKKSDYRGRCLYYWELCLSLDAFRAENKITMPELCALLYDYAPNLIEKEDKGTMPPPAQAWFIGGQIKGYGTHWTSGFWQSSTETKKGDILIHYETSPVSALTCIWTAQVDGVLDPFFKYYSHTYIADKIDIPKISLKELQQDEYFCKHPLVRKKFQGVNGWPVSSEDYSELVRMIKAKGFDASQLPVLYAPSLSYGQDIQVERDVETKLLEPLLKTMGLEEQKDYIRQLPIHAGRGHRVFPDYALHYSDKPDEETARVLIEAKYHMKNNQEIEAAFLQARSYAMLLDSSVIILCDKHCLLIYEKRQSFDRDRYAKLYWGELEDPDKYNALKNLLQ